MVSTTSKTDSKDEGKQTLNSKNPKNVYQIGGLQVEFPYQPYGTQLAFMSRVISTLDRAQREGHCHALLESPTGTGKSLSLLCSVLAWQQSYKSRFPNGNLSHSNHGGGFIPKTHQPSDAPLHGNVEPVEPDIPTIYYASRTHAQITQVIREYRKTGYRVPMTVLGSRKRYCTNRHVQGKEDVDEKCRLLLKDKKNIKCPEFQGIDRILAYPSLKQNGHNGVHDIEDLVKIGKTVTGCPYFASWNMLEVAQLVFCPYSYIIDPVIRGGVNLKGAIIIFDEAHNMEDIAREAGSINLEEETLCKLRNELEKMSEDEPETYEPLYEVVEKLISWIGRKKDSLAKRDSDHYFSSWTGERALRKLKEFNITKECFPSLHACFNIATTRSEAAEMDPDKPYNLSGISVSTLEELFATLTYFFSRDGSHVLDYEMGLQRSTKRGDTGWTHTFSLWCMNPSVVFKDLADLSLSIILTSGTLSPMNSFLSELGMQFGTCLEAPHVIDPKIQVWAGAISNGPGNFPLNASYKTADEYAFQDALGKSLEEICSIVPGGSLVFFPSYKLMEKLCSRWQETGQWSRLCLKRDLFIEPRGGAKEDFETVLKEYYDSIRGKKRLIGTNSRIKKAWSVITKAQDDSKKGSAFLAVCRGKVSEGLDFSDDNARAVIIVGIPFPNLHDILIELKRKYNDTYKSSKNLLGGSKWYCQQAYRAINQAAGRCIRHRFDYGAIIFLDERYRQTTNRESISKWLRQSIKLYDNFEESMEELRSFFNTVKERVDSKMLESHEQNLSSENQSKEYIRKQNQIQNKSSHVEPKDMTGRNVVDYTSSNAEHSFMNKSKRFLDIQRSMRLSESSVRYIPAHTFIQVKEKAVRYKEVIDLECGVQLEPGYSEVSSVTNCDIYSGMINGITTGSPCSSSKNESSSLATGLRSLMSPQQFLKRHISTENFRRSPLGAESSVIERVDSKMLESHEQNLSSENQSKEYTRRKENQIQNKSSHVEPKDMTGRNVVGYTSSNAEYSFMNKSKRFSDHKDVKPKIAEGSRSMRLSESSVGYIPAHTFIQVKEEPVRYKEVIDLECGVQLEPGYCEVSSVTNCDEDAEKSVSGMINGITTSNPCSSSKNESSSLTTGLRSLKSPEQFLKRQISTENFRRSPLGAESSVIVSPETYSNGDTSRLTLDAESPLNMSVNSHALKRRKFTTSSVIIDLEEENSDAPSTRPADHTSLTRRIEFGFGSTGSRSQNDDICAFPEVNQRVMRISCSLCGSSLGHPENHSYLNCSLTSSCKTHLLSLLKATSGTGSAEMPTSVSVIMTDCSLVNQRLCRSSESSKGQGIWCEQDGCVFHNIFCPFCSVPNTCLGVQIMATDSANVQFMNKIMFFADHIEVTNDAASKDTTLMHKESLAVTDTAVSKNAVFETIKQQQESEGDWESTKSKL